jgi:tetratricopeptide (TPR) repeat protein
MGPATPCRLAPEREEPERTRRVRLLCRTGYAHYDAGDPARALRHFYRAWLLLPRPQHECRESGWILTAIGDAYHRLGDHRSSAEALRSALHCPGIRGNPFVHLRLGECCSALGLEAEAAEHLRIAAENGDATHTRFGIG